MRVAIIFLAACSSFVPDHVQPSARPKARPNQLDVNGDGFADIVAGEVNRVYAAKLTTAGRVLVYFGGPHGPRATPDLELVGPGGAPLAGDALVQALGDVDGDGTTDLLVADHDAGRGATFGYVCFGGPAGPHTQPDLELTTPNRDLDHVALFAAGDIDGDGFADIGASANCPPAMLPISHPDPRACTAGLAALYVFAGSASGVSTTPTVTLQRPFEVNQPVIGLGDVDGDGFDDVLWGTEILRGGRGGLTTGVTLEAADGGALAIRWAYRAGDLDHDGLADVVITGTSETDYAGPLHTWLYSRLAPKPARDLAEFPIIAVGDVTGDGIDDAVTYVNDIRIVGGATLSEPAVNVTHVVSPGDIDGDGRRDLVIGTDHIAIYRDVTAPPTWTLTRPDASPYSFPEHLAGATR